MRRFIPNRTAPRAAHDQEIPMLASAAIAKPQPEPRCYRADRFCLRYGRDQHARVWMDDNNAVTISVPVPVCGLAQRAEETVPLRAGSEVILPPVTGKLVLARDGETGEATGGVWVSQVSSNTDGSLEMAHEAYRAFTEILASLNGSRLHRVWAFVPKINFIQPDGMEVYRDYNRGRLQAFEEHTAATAPDFRIPAASAVGTEADSMVLVFTAGRQAVEFLENPTQMPACQYPEQYGPRPPAFARATATSLNGQRIGYLSGTASIKGHESVHMDSLMRQLETTVDNMRIMASQMEMPGAFDAAGSKTFRRQIKVYLRSADDYELAKGFLEQQFKPAVDEELLLVRADICRAELDVEIDAMVVPR